jgi:hypothetical protein
MLSSSHDPNLPGDEGFVPSPPIVEVEVIIPHPVNGRLVSISALAMTISPEAQAAQHHNLLRYSELQKLRLGQPNMYRETRYR